ncbi:hypothetical protein J2Y63_005786 [Shinella sp. BE166]|uniref:DUF2628 domain-containing protein n=1 Tax=Shinella sp. BE166 TaxID=3373918 RepID=UPI003EBD742A
MATFLFLIPPGAKSQDENARIIRDHFSWIAFFLPYIWLLWHRAWLAAALVFAIQSLGSVLSEHAVFGFAGVGICLATSLLVALEGPTMIVAGLRRAGWTVDAVISADDRATAEEIYYMDIKAGEPETRHTVSLPASETSTRRHAPMLGLVGFGEGR